MKESPFKQRLKEIDRADKRGLGSCGVELATQLVRDFPDRGRAWFEFATAIYPVARYNEALAALRRALRLCPPERRYVVQAHFGHLYEKKGEFHRAETWFRKAVAGAPREAHWRIFLGGVLAVSGRLKEAEAVFREAARCSGGCIDEAYLNLGLVLRAQRQYKEARACFQKALKISPTYKEARHHLHDIEQALILRGKRANPQGRANARQPLRSVTIRESSAAASRRSP